MITQMGTFTGKWKRLPVANTQKMVKRRRKALLLYLSILGYVIDRFPAHHFGHFRRKKEDSQKLSPSVRTKWLQSGPEEEED